MRQIDCPTCRAKVDVKADPWWAREMVCPACGEKIRLDSTQAQPEAATPAEVPQPNRYEVKKRETLEGGGGRVSGMIITVIAAIVIALVLALVFGIIRSLFWLVVIFPIIHGFVIGLPISGIAWLSRARFAGWIAVVGGVSGVLSVLAIHYLNYMAYAAGAPPQGAAGSFWEFISMEAEEGVQIGRATGGGGKGTNLGYTGSIIYWIVEAIITACGAAGGAVVFLMKPYCEKCRDWKKKDKKYGPFLIDMPTAITAVESGCPSEMIAPTETLDKVTIEIFRCPHCEGEEIDVRVSGVRPVKGGVDTNLSVMVAYPRAAEADFEKVARTCKEKNLETS